MKRLDKYPPATPEDLARIETMSHKGRVHPLLWVVGVVLVIIGVGVYSDIVGFYEFEELEEYVTGEEEHDDEKEDDDEEDLHPMERQLMERKLMEPAKNTQDQPPTAAGAEDKDAVESD